MRGSPPSWPFRLLEVSSEQAGPADHAATGRARRSKRGYFVPGLIALVVLAVGGGLANFGGLDHAAPNRLAGPDVETFLAQAIQARDGLSSPPHISCPASEPVRAGLRFTCTWHRAGGDRRLGVTETGRGQFRFTVEPAS